jgi:hypothetical protein
MHPINFVKVAFTPNSALRVEERITFEVASLAVLKTCLRGYLAT